MRRILWLTKYTSQAFVEGRMAGEKWKSKESRFRGCRSSFMDNLDSVAPLEYKSRSSLFPGWVMDAVDISLIDRA